MRAKTREPPHKPLHRVVGSDKLTEYRKLGQNEFVTIKVIIFYLSFSLSLALDKHVLRAASEIVCTEFDTVLHDPCSCSLHIYDMFCTTLTEAYMCSFRSTSFKAWMQIKHFFNRILLTEHRMQNMCLQQLLFDIVHKTFIYSTGTCILFLFECAIV